MSVEQWFESLARSIKDTVVSSEPVEKKYSRFFALADLCMQLLTGRSKGYPGSADELQFLVAKVMLEKNLIITQRLAEIDI
jgi:hypothetical protein